MSSGWNEKTKHMMEMVMMIMAIGIINQENHSTQLSLMDILIK
jgi:hypothetical protein